MAGLLNTNLNFAVVQFLAKHRVMGQEKLGLIFDK